MGYFDFDIPESIRLEDRAWMFEKEHFADTFYNLGIITFLTFALSNYIENDSVCLDFDKVRDTVRCKIMNCGIPCVYYCFNQAQFDRHINKYYDGAIRKCFDKYEVDMKSLVEGWDNLSQEEKDFIYPYPNAAKTFCLICNLGFILDSRIDLRVLQTFHLVFWRQD